MTSLAGTLRSELIGLGGIVERNVYLTKRYFLWDVAFMVWTIANTLTIVFIARSVHVSAAEENALATRLLVLEPPDELKRRYGAETLEEAFFAATGREFEAEGDEDDEIREVFG